MQAVAAALRAVAAAQSLQEVSMAICYTRYQMQAVAAAELLLLLRAVAAVAAAQS